MEDGKIKNPLGIMEDVLVKMEKFIILEIEKNNEIPIFGGTFPSFGDNFNRYITRRVDNESGESGSRFQSS